MATEHPREQSYYTCTHEQLMELVFEAAGAATGPLMQDHPDYEFPSERVSLAVAEVIREKTGIEPNDIQGYSIEKRDPIDALRQDIHNRNQKGTQRG